MNILILGYGLEGKSAERFFKHDPSLFEHTKIDILSSFEKEELLFKDFSHYDLIFRTPSVPPKFINAPAEKITSCTKYFFQNCPCPVIGVTGTKGKGTTCTLIRDLLKSLGQTPHLVGNIGTPALDILPDLKKSNIIIYELSSFQLWDLQKSPNISVVLRIEPDHLDVHDSFTEYLTAKTNIAQHQTPDDFLIYFKNNQNTQQIAQTSKAQKLPYPIETTENSLAKQEILPQILQNLQIPGEHNKENAQAALLAVFAYFCKYQNYTSKHPKNLSQAQVFTDFLQEHMSELSSALKNFQPLPHHIEFVRELNNVSYYDDSFSTVSPALEAALNSFKDQPLVLIAGGKDKGTDIKPVQDLIFHQPNLIKAVLIGETSEKIAWGQDPAKFVLCGKDFNQAIHTAQTLAEDYLKREEENSDTCIVDAKKPIKNPVVLLSPCASSFDMFTSYKARGDKFKQIVLNLK